MLQQKCRTSRLLLIADRLRRAAQEYPWYTALNGKVRTIQPQYRLSIRIPAKKKCGGMYGACHPAIGYRINDSVIRPSPWRLQNTFSDGPVTAPPAGSGRHQCQRATFNIASSHHRVLIRVLSFSSSLVKARAGRPLLNTSPSADLNKHNRLKGQASVGGNIIVPMPSARWPRVDRVKGTRIVSLSHQCAFASSNWFHMEEVGSQVCIGHGFGSLQQTAYSQPLF